MGKRELLIAIAFIVAGTAAYQFTAPPAKPGQQGFSFSKIWSNARRGIHGNSAQASVTQSGTIPLRPGHHELRVAGIRGVRIMGEARSDVAYELTASSNGADQAAATALANQVVLKQDDVGTILVLRAVYPHDGTQTGSIILRVPSRLATRIDGATGAYATNVASVDIENVNGDVTIL